MHRFFIKPEQLEGDEITIAGGDYNHIRNVLRMKSGDTVLLCDEGDKEYLCKIDKYNIERKTVSLQIVDIFGNARELSARITLFQGYPKGDKMENIVQKAVELGVYEVVPTMMKRSVVKLDEKKVEKKGERLNGIARSAAKQSKRGVIPEVRRVMTMEQAVQYAGEMEYIIVPYEQAEGMEHARRVLEGAKGKKTIAVFIGPEGGMEPSEVRMIEAVGGQSITLGNRILRTETAGMTMMSLLMFLLEE